MEAYKRLEFEWAEFNQLDQRGMVACSSGTAALHLALEAMELPYGSIVIVPDFTMVACPRAVTLAGLTPVFVDCGNDLLVDQWQYKERDFSAIMLVHVYGRQCDMDSVCAFAAQGGDIVIEDLAEAHGTCPHDTTDAACWSFYKNKVVAGQEGGAVWFRDHERAPYARQLRSLGFTEEHDFTHIPRGHNYRMSNAHAELILASLENYENNLRSRRGRESVYDAWCPDEWRQPPRQVPWVYDIRIRGMSSVTQNLVVAALQKEGILARHGFKPMSCQLEYRECRKVGGANALVASREVVYLPLTPGGPPVNGEWVEIIRKIVG